MVDLVHSVNIRVRQLPHFDSALGTPFYHSEGASGADLKVCWPDKVSRVVAPGEKVLVPTGLCFEVPSGFEIQVRPRSGLSLRTGLMVVNSPGTIDSDYRGELQILLGNLGNDSHEIRHGDRVAQMVIAPVIRGEFVFGTELSSSTRGDRGFGSTGVESQFPPV